MTTGTKVLDHRHLVSTYCGSNMLVGSLVEKTWSGNDDPIKHVKANAYNMLYRESRDGVLTWWFDSNTTRKSGTWGSCFGGISCQPLEWTSNDDLSLLNKLGDKIRGHEFNAAVSLGAEGKDALAQIAGAAKNVFSGFRDLRRGDGQSALRKFGLSPSKAKQVGLDKTLAQKVLATQLGWLPLLGDIDSAYGALRALTEKPQSRTYTATRRIKSDCLVMGDPEGVAGRHYISKKLSWTLSEDFDVWQSLSVSNPWDMADTIWNATTLSFIADWFIPIGKYLSARSLVYNLKGEGYLSTYDDTTVRGISRFLDYHVEGADVYFNRNLNVTRVPLTSLDGLVALPRFKDFIQIPSWKRALTAVTLATQMFR